MKQNDSVCWSRWNEWLNNEGGRSKLKEREDKVWSIGYVCMRACVRRRRKEGPRWFTILGWVRETKTIRRFEWNRDGTSVVAVTVRRCIKLCVEWKTKRRRVKWRRMSVWIGGEMKREERERERGWGRGRTTAKGIRFHRTGK